MTDHIVNSGSAGPQKNYGFGGAGATGYWDVNDNMTSSLNQENGKNEFWQDVTQEVLQRAIESAYK